MEFISKNILKNNYIGTKRSSCSFIELLKTAIKNIDKDLILKNKKYYYALIKYPNHWPSKLDLFSFIDDQIISEIKNKNCYFIFDATYEGFSPFTHNWFEIFYFTCEKYNIDPSQIILASSNLKDEENIKLYAYQTNKKPINVISILFFETRCQVSGNIDKIVPKFIKKTQDSFKNKYFSSLSRMNRVHRKEATFLLCQSTVKDQGLISHNKIDKIELKECYFNIIDNTPYTHKHVKRWAKSLPLIVDYKDFDTNWACDREFEHIHNQTIFQIVNETLSNNENNTSLFYSEKTFRPISCFQPFLIYGQVGCNHYLKNLGYKTYEDWFDLSFDYEEDDIKRYQKILLVVEDTCKYLDSLTRDQKIEWKFKNQDILIHNVKTMNTQKHTFEKLEKFVLKLESQIVV